MKTSIAQTDLLDSDISSLFERQGLHTSPDDLDRRILDAAALSVKGVSGDFNSPLKRAKRLSPMLLLSVALLLAALCYPVVNRFLDLPSVVQDSTRVFQGK